MKKLISYGGKRQPAGPSYMKIALQLLIILLATLLVLINLLTHVFMVVRYYGGGMEPALSDQQIIVLRKTDKVEQGDIVAFYYNNKILVRRIICEGGSTVSISNGGKVTIDGVLLEEPYVEKPSVGMHNIDFPYHVPYGQFFVMGDNRETAMDSRLSEIGPVPAERLIGKVILTF